MIRRETYIYLKELEAKLLGRNYSYNTKTEAFAGIEKNNVSLPRARPCRSSATPPPTSWQTTTMLKGAERRDGTRRIDRRRRHPRAQRLPLPARVVAAVA